MSKDAGNGEGRRTRIAQAQGMVSVQAGCTLAEALVLMTDTATATDETLAYIAGEILAGRLRFD